eukprot:11920658-Alexandrium_andersonii.AAC.1
MASTPRGFPTMLLMAQVQLEQGPTNPRKKKRPGTTTKMNWHAATRAQQPGEAWRPTDHPSAAKWR